MKHDNDNRSDGLRFLSVCSGIEAASVAWPQWQAVAFSEIEKFPSAVLAHHYPGVPNLGDFTKIDTTKLGRVDILCGGTPCQAFSVAGLRQSLADERGNLSLEFVRLAHELADGNGLRNVVWENVPGVLSTRDNAFGCFLGGLVGADAAIDPPTRGKWGSAGLVSGPKGRAAWRICDAQYWGVAQRRRRVIVVADFGIGADPAAVLFEPESLPRHSPPSREAGEKPAPTISARTKGGGGLGTDFDLDGGLVEAVAYGGNRTSGPIDISPALAAHPGPHGRQSFESEAFLVQPLAFTAKDYGGDAQVDLSPTLRAGGHSGSHANAGVMPAVTVAIRGREGGATAELGGEVATALRASQGGGDKPHVLAFDTYNQDVAEVTHTLRRGSGHGDAIPAILQSAVRRLTPVECERLQGFPDNYTRIPWRGKPAEECPDGPRYKALGNSWAVPLFAWLGRRIDKHMPPLAATHNNKDTTIADAA